MVVGKGKNGGKVASDRPKMFLDLTGYELRDCSYMGRSGHYAIRIGAASILMAKGVAEKVAWAILQRQARLQKDGTNK